MSMPDVIDTNAADRQDSAGVSKTGKWAITAIATVLSTYVLDAVATACGVLLVASHLLAGADHLTALLFLAGSYIVWGAGLRVNLHANWLLLESTGTSSNALSKAAYDIARLRTDRARPRRIAADVGYAGSELAKEAPYYIGAIGAAAFTDKISAIDAIVFLGGTNLGAALYEYCLAHLVRAVLRRGKTAA